jgi:hypothetical protein
MKKLNLSKFTMALGVILFLSLYSCSNELTIEVPKGPAGASAYEVWVQAVKDGAINWDAGRTDLNNYFLFLKGENGKDAYQVWMEEVAKGVEDPHNIGQQWPKGKTGIQDFWYFLTGAKGQDGSTPVIGSNGNWFIDGIDTKFPSYGKDGSVITIGDNGDWFIDGKDMGIPTKSEDDSAITIGDNGNWFVDRQDTGIPVDGKDGSTVTIGDNGNWFIDGKDTGIPAKGKNGSIIIIGDNGNWFIDGKDTGKPASAKDGSVVTIGNNGNWYIDGKDTGVTAFGRNGKDGEDGEDGENGKSAYELWVEEVKTGTVDNPHDPGQKWPASKTSTQDFWVFMQGKDGEDGEDGGSTNQPGETIAIVHGVPNVIPLYSNQTFNEFVRPDDGSVHYMVYNDAGVPVGSGVTVQGLPGIDPSKSYTTLADGTFAVPKEDLPDNVNESLRRGITASVSYTNSHGTSVIEPSASNTYVPNRMWVRIRLQSDPELTNTHITFKPVVERKTDGGAWETIPAYLENLKQNIVARRLNGYTNPDDSIPGSYYKVTYLPTANTKFDVSSTAITARVVRLKKPVTTAHYGSTPYYPDPSPIWDGGDYYFRLVLESFYGEKPEMDAVVKMAPVQAMPMIKNVTASGDNANPVNYVDSVKGWFDINTAAGGNIDPALIYKKVLKKENRTSGTLSYAYYSPEIETDATVWMAAELTVRFNHSSSNHLVNQTKTLADPEFKITTPYIDASVVLDCDTEHYFYSWNTIGKFEKLSPSAFEIRNNTSSYDYSDISVPYTYIP